MCLFKRDEQENTCNHEECNNYYLLNKHICMYSKQNQEAKLPKLNDEHNLLDLLQKKLKKDPDAKSYSQEVSTQPSYNQNFTLNSLMMPQIQVKTEAPSSKTESYSPFVARPQNVQQHYQLPAPDLRPPNPHSNLSLVQLMNLKNQNNISENQKSNAVKHSENTNNRQSVEESMRDFQNKLLNLMLSQNKILVDLKDKNDLMQDTLGCLVSEVASLKNCLKPAPRETLQPSVKPTGFTQIIGRASDTINTDNLLTYLYGPSCEFQYHLVLKQELSLPLYRERNFKFTVMLVDKEGKLVENSNRIPLTIGIYSSENPPKYIDTNTSGNKILKGFIEKDLKNGTATFEKIQIKEVTSHFRNGWVFFVVYPKVVAGMGMVTVDGNANFVNIQKIKPLVLEKVVVKAKKTKEKGNAAEAEENIPEEMEQEKEEAASCNS